MENHRVYFQVSYVKNEYFNTYQSNDWDMLKVLNFSPISSVVKIISYVKIVEWMLSLIKIVQFAEILWRKKSERFKKLFLVQKYYHQHQNSSQKSFRQRLQRNVSPLHSPQQSTQRVGQCSSSKTNVPALFREEKRLQK